MENRIKDILSEKGLTAKELSSDIGLSSVSLYNIINGKQKASANTLNAIAIALDVPFWQLFVAPESINQNELTALVEFKGELHKAHSIAELEQLVERLKG
ncbi:helix-turn-helix domain-containing protein [Barnesiella intestinihominis]|uniref:helix-turn-helix domain-containing protein n=1 Tax=Barnesiella intestinihominis TaxID=487174 RepID=UPI003AB12DC7